LISPQFGEVLSFSYRSILDISEHDYRIEILLTSNEQLSIFNLGYRYEDFLRIMIKLRNELLLKDLLMNEKMRKSVAEAEFVYYGSAGDALQKGGCELRLYETALVVMPDKGELIRFPYSDLSGIDSQNYTLTINTETGEKLSLSQMGGQFDPFARALSEANAALQLKVNSLLMRLFPNADPSLIRRVARFMKEGRAARRVDIESVSPTLWKELEKKLGTVGVMEEYDFLKAMSQQEKICIGVKQSLLGDLTGEYVWFLIPIYSTNPSDPGNAVVMEASSQEGTGKATYFFRIVGRKEYKDFRNIDDLHREVDLFIKRMNRCMIDINFRREPIYLPAERLDEPKYERYRFALQKIPSLKVLRELFIGRVIHSTPEQWKGDVKDLLKFNVSTEDDSAKWSKGEPPDTDEDKEEAASKK